MDNAQRLALVSGFPNLTKWLQTVRYIYLTFSLCVVIEGRFATEAYKIKIGIMWWRTMEGSFNVEDNLQYLYD